MHRSILSGLILILLAAPPHAVAENDQYVPPKAMILPTGFAITPMDAPESKFEPLNPGLHNFPKFVASGATTTVVSPDQKTLLVLTSGYNLNNTIFGKRDGKASQQYVFVYDITGGQPVRKQVLKLPNSFAGISFYPGGQVFYVGGASDDDIHVFVKHADEKWSEDSCPIRLKNKPGNGLNAPETRVTGGVAVTADGSKIVVANVYNDSVSIVDLRTHAISQLDLRPGKSVPAKHGVPGGEYPFWVVT